MHAMYLACLVGGLVATAVFALLGAIGGAAGHAAGHLHAGPVHTGPVHAGPAHAAHLPTTTAHGQAVAAHSASGQATAPGSPGHAAHAHDATPSGAAAQGAAPGWLATMIGWTASWFSPLTLAAGALWFGGVGLIAESALPGGLTALALLLAILGAILGAAVVRAVMAALLRSSTPPLSSDAVGAVGTLSAPIRADAPGEVIYTLEGLRRSAAARCVDGRLLPRGTNVVIVRRERGIAWVESLDPLAGIEQSSDVGALPVARQGDLSPPP